MPPWRCPALGGCCALLKPSKRTHSAKIHILIHSAGEPAVCTATAAAATRCIPVTSRAIRPDHCKVSDYLTRFHYLQIVNGRLQLGCWISDKGGARQRAQRWNAEDCRVHRACHWGNSSNKRQLPISSVRNVSADSPGMTHSTCQLQGNKSTGAETIQEC